MKYICENSFLVDSRDDDESLIEEDGLTIDKGSVWEIDQHVNPSMGEVRLRNIKDDSWLELSNETLEKYFVVQ